MIENEEKNNTAQQSRDVIDLGTDDLPDIIDLSDMETPHEAFGDEVIDLSSLENDDSADSDDGLIDLSSLESHDMEETEEGGVLDLIPEFRVDASSNEDALLEDEYKDLSLDLDEESVDDLPVEDDSFFELAEESGELLLEKELAISGVHGESEAPVSEGLLQDMDYGDEEDFEIDLANMIESEEEVEFSEIIDNEEYSLDEFIEEGETLDEEDKDSSFPEDELLEKLDDYFGDDDTDDNFDLGTQQQAIPKEMDDLAPDQFETALDRMIEKKFGKKFDLLVNEMVAQRVSEEMDAIKSVILNSIKNR